MIKHPPKTSEQLRALALESAANGVVITDSKGIIQWVNPAFTKLTGYLFGEVVGKSTSILKSGKQDESFYKNLWETITSGEVWSGEIINRKKDGSLYTEEEIITPVKSKSGKIISFIAIKQDITEKKKFEEELIAKDEELIRVNKSQEETRQAMLNVLEDLESTRAWLKLEKVKDDAILASIGEGLIAVDNDAKIMIINRAAENILGWKMKDVVGKEITISRLEDEDGNPIPRETRPTQIALSTGKMLDGIYYFVRNDKTRFPIAINVTPIKLAGKIIGAIDIFRDVTKEREIDKAKSEFVSLASHQLRTPLGIMKWYLEAFKNEDYFNKAPDNIKKYFAEIYKNNERVLNLVRDLLSVSRIDQGNIRDNPTSVDILSILREIVEQMQNLANAKQITLSLIIPDQNIPPITIDQLRFHEVMENLICNAIEYTSASGSIDVMVTKTAECVSISVKDTGMGISVADQKRLFTKFFRSQNAVGQNIEGTGLGLYVVKSYVEGWGGKIFVESIEGKGSTFTINLPIFRKER